MKKVFLPVCLLFFGWGWAQTANDCSNAIVVCGNSVITSNVSGFGTQELDGSRNPCEFSEVNSLWLQLNIDRTGTLEFTLTPDSKDIEADYDFYIYGPNFNCGNFDAPVRCSSTNPEQAGLTSNLTGLRAGEIDESEGPGPAGNSFIAPLDVVAGETYFLLIDRPEGNGGFSLDWQGSSDFVDPPVINFDIDPISACFADAGSPVDLTLNANQITSDPSIFYEYYRSRENAFDGVQEINNPTAYPIDSSTTVFIKGTSGNSCFEIVEQRINIDAPFSADLSYTACDGDNNGTETFELQPIFEDIDGGLQTPSNYTVSLHPTENDADNNMAALTTATYETSDGTIYARIASNTDATCFLTVPVTLVLLDTPVALPAELVQCDVDVANSTDGLTTFDLEQIFETVTATESFDYLFYESEQLRNLDTPIANIQNYVNTTPFSQTLYYRISTETCESLGEIDLNVVSTTVEPTAQSPLISCASDFGGASLEASFDLDGFRAANFPDSDIAFYATLENASLERGALSGEITSGNTTIYIRIEDDNQCRTIASLELRVNPLPEIDLADEFYICEENPDLEIRAPTGFEKYTWARIDAGTITEIGTAETIRPTAAGEYRLIVEQSTVINGQSILCTHQKDFTVRPSNPATITDIFITGTGNETALDIRVSGDGNYEYSIDGATYSDSNIIENIASGTVTVSVRDKNGCGEVQETVSVFGYPNFFTPNGDAVNDFWQIIGADPESSTTANISIFDRYGKFIGQIDPLGQGWDGTFNSTPLPESDYWFKVRISGQREVKGHFSLKR
ncbi:MAG: T9SS type B sorting domain-containing protein [Pricia sp.]